MHPNADSTRKVYASKTPSQGTIFSNAKCITLDYMAYLFLSHSFLVCVKTWSLGFSPYLFHKYTATSAKHNKYEA